MDFLLAVGMKEVGNTLTLRRPRKLASPERSRTFSPKLVPRGQDLGPPVSDSIRGPLAGELPRRFGVESEECHHAGASGFSPVRQFSA
jgi:hypothetical protein